MKLALALLLVGSVASADTLKPTGLQLGMRFPWELTLQDHTGIGVLGLGLDLGERVTDRLYLGVSADYMFRIQLTTDDDPLISRFRGGVEARYVFHEGTATMGGGGGDCCCNPYTEGTEVPRYDWIGARFGATTVDGFGSYGRFGELELGTDMQGGNVQLGGYLAVGYESDAIAPTTAARSTTTPATTDDGEYFTVGLRLTFGG